MMGKAPDQRIVIAWYRRDQWARLLRVSADAGELEETCDQWLAHAAASVAALEQTGATVKKSMWMSMSCCAGVSSADA